MCTYIYIYMYIYNLGSGWRSRYPRSDADRVKRCVKGKGKFLNSAVSNPRDCSKRFTLYFPGSPVQSDSVSTSLGSIQPYTAINARRLLVHIPNPVYSHVLINTGE